jgi:hypothetical protein
LVSQLPRFCTYWCNSSRLVAIPHPLKSQHVARVVKLLVIQAIK